MNYEQTADIEACPLPDAGATGPETAGLGEAFLPEGLSPTGALRCLLCGGCTGCGETEPCEPCQCDGVEGAQVAVCDRGGDDHSGRRYPWISYSRRYGNTLLQQLCEEHMLLGMKRASQHGVTRWQRPPAPAPAAWVGAPVPRV